MNMVNAVHFHIARDHKVVEIQMSRQEFKVIEVIFNRFSQREYLPFLWDSTGSNSGDNCFAYVSACWITVDKRQL